MTDAELIASTYIPVRTQAERLRHAILQVRCARTGIAALSGIDGVDMKLCIAECAMRVMLASLDAFIDEQES